MTNETLFAEAILGKDAEEFLASDLGRYLIGRAKQEEEEAILALTEVDAESPKTIRDLQTRVWRAKSVMTWIAELIESGRSAEAALQSDVV